MPSASIQARTAVRIGVLSTPPQSVITPRNSRPLSTTVILGASRTAGRTATVDFPRPSGEGSAALWPGNVTGPTYNQSSRNLVERGPPRGCAAYEAFTGSGGRTMPDLSSLRLVKVPPTAPPYDCQVHGARCPADADVGPGVEETPAVPVVPVVPVAPTLGRS